MKIAIIGTGISGLTVAHLLHQEHELTLFEAGDHVGGHTHTHDVKSRGKKYAVDTGFIVFNDWTYPNFIKLLDKIGQKSQPTSMSFSVKCERTGIEYNGTNLNSLFAQRTNLLSPKFHRMIMDIFRFNREAPKALLKSESARTTLGQYLKQHRYSHQFIDLYIVPMGAAIWSAKPRTLLKIPMQFFVQFFKNHGMLSVDDRPQWRVIKGGSREYVRKLILPFEQRIRINAPIKSIRRQDGLVYIKPVQGEEEVFDRAVIATHSDQALKLLSDPTEREQEILGAIPYQPNDTVLHTDSSILPKKKIAWAAWNYHRPRQQQDRVAVTYDMNILQGLKSRETFCTTLNYSQEIERDKILKEMVYHHPIFNPKSVAAQKRHDEINGPNNTFYCGAYWFNGFHEDGVRSGLAVAEKFGKAL